MSAVMTGHLPLYLNKNFFKTVLENGLRRSNINVQDIYLENVPLGGENYCSEIYRVLVKYQIFDAQEEEQEEERSLIIKSLPKRKQGVLKLLNIYNKETLFYLDLKIKMETLMWFKSSPWILGAKHFYSTSYPEETIVLEDLAKERFEIRSRQVGLDEEHAIFVMQKLAEYHALTMVMIEKEPELITNRYPYGLLNLDSIKSAPFTALFGAQLLKLASLIEDLPEFEEISKKLYKYYNKFTEHILKAVYPLIGELNVLNHGDLWVNNIFFSYGAQEKLTEVRFIDFQLCFFGSPGFDINYFLHTSVQLDVLQYKRHLLLDTYYKHLILTLKYLPYEQSLPSYEQLLHDVQTREAYGFFVAFAFFPLMSMISIDSEDNSLEKLHDENFAREKIELMFKSNERTMQTLKYVLKRTNDLGLLD